MDTVHSTDKFEGHMWGSVREITELICTSVNNNGIIINYSFMRPPRRWELMIWIHVTLIWNTAEQTWREQCVSGEYQDGSIYQFISADNTEITVSF